MPLVLGRRTSETALDRPVPLRMRADLIVRRREVRGRTRYVLKDPISSRHHQLWEEEFELLRMLNGSSTPAQMQLEFESRFRPKKLDVRRLQALHGLFHRNGLVTSETSGQAVTMTRRRRGEKQKQVIETLSNPLAIRLRGFNPDRLLDRMDEWLGVLFQPQVVLLLLFFVLVSAAVFVGDSLSRPPDIRSLQHYLTPGNALLLVIVFAGVKVLHELAHGLSCKHFGGECNELGAMFLAFVPCLYCDVSDAWLIDSKWKRAATAAAGIWIELVAAAVCVWIWRFSRPGILHTISFEVILVGGIGTILVNANPLLRYDGYFVLSDVLESPNLWERSRRGLRLLAKRFFYQHRRLSDSDLEVASSPWGLAAFAAASITYQWVALILLLFAVTRFLIEIRLEAAAAALITSVALGFAFQSWRKIESFRNDPQRTRGLNKSRVAFAGVIVMLALIGVFTIPLPRSVIAPFELQPRYRRAVTVTVDGRLKSCRAEGGVVRAGEVIAELYSPEHDLETARKRGKIAAQTARLESLESRRQTDETAAAQITTLRESIAGLRSELQRLESVRDSFIIRAPCDGIVTAPPSKATQGDDTPDDSQSDAADVDTVVGIETWSGTPLAAENLGCRLRPGDTLCYIADGPEVDGIAYLTQSQIELVKAGQNVTAVQTLMPIRINGIVTETAAASGIEIPAELARAGKLPAKGFKGARAMAVEPMFAVRIEFSPAASGCISQASGTARIRVASATMATRLYRFLSECLTLTPARE